MTPEFYRVLHVVGVLVLFLGLGGALLGSKDGKAPRSAMVLHGVGLLIMLVAGIGTVHKDDAVDWGNWLYAKIGCWVLIAAMPTLVKKRMVPGSVGLILVIALGAAAVWLAQTKPF